MISIWLISFWENLKKPKKINIVELGAGNGEMMSQIIKTLNNFSEISLSANFLILEKSPLLIKIDDLNRHPSQIYEAIFEGVVLFIILNMLFKRLRKSPGIISGYFLILYSFFRFVIEFFREPDQQLGYLFFNLSMGQIISCIALTCGLIIVYYKNANRTQ